MELSDRYENQFERAGQLSQSQTNSSPALVKPGFSLVQYETDTGQLVFEWRRREMADPAVPDPSSRDVVAPRQARTRIRCARYREH